jgi:hypothetical protein
MILASCAPAGAGQIWTDGNGDGLPDGSPPAAPPSTNVTIGVWIDAQSFSWTNFLAYIEWTGQCISYVSASYVISGGSNFPIDNFSHPRGIGFGGSGYAQGGVDHIGNMTLHIDSPVSCCVTPIIDQYNPYYVFSQLGAGSAYMLFSTNPGTCYGCVGCNDGACCFPDGSCVVVTPAECAAQGGLYRGDNVSCAEAQCDGGPPTEACCFCDGSCVETPVGQCPPNSIPQGQGTTCDPPSCGPPPVACCFPDGSCITMTPCGECEAAGGVPQVGVQCDDIVCPQPVVGACCLPSSECVDVTEAECGELEGIWVGFGTCIEVPCPNSVEPQTWGRIKGLFR